MKVYTISERQAIKDRLADERHFEADCTLFRKLFPNHVLIGELARANRVNKAALSRKVIYQLLTRVDEAAILEYRNNGTGEPAVNNETTTGPSTENKPTEVQEKPKQAPAKKATKADEFPRINWLDNSNEDIQLAILLYDERVNTWLRLKALREDLDDCPEKAVMISELDDRNRMAQHELEVFQETGIFPCKHPMAVQFVADRKKMKDWKELKAKDPDAFLKQVTNIQHNISRYKSELKKKDLKEDKRKRIKANLAKAEYLNELMQRVVGQ